MCSHGKFSTETTAHFGRTSLQVQLHAGIATALQCKGVIMLVYVITAIAE